MTVFTMPSGLEGQELHILIFTTIRNHGGQGITLEELQSELQYLDQTRLKNVLNNLSRKNYIALAFDIAGNPRYIAFPSFHCYMAYCIMQEAYSAQLEASIKKGTMEDGQADMHIFHMTDQDLASLLNSKRILSENPISQEEASHLINLLLRGEYIGYHSENTYYFHHVGYTSCVGLID